MRLAQPRDGPLTGSIGPRHPLHERAVPLMPASVTSRKTSSQGASSAGNGLLESVFEAEHSCSASSAVPNLALTPHATICRLLLRIVASAFRGSFS
jgi:hypothetical protein